jgi:hypothetical protein
MQAYYCERLTDLKDVKFTNKELKLTLASQTEELVLSPKTFCKVESLCIIGHPLTNGYHIYSINLPKCYKLIIFGAIIHEANWPEVEELILDNCILNCELPKYVIHCNIMTSQTPTQLFLPICESLWVCEHVEFGIVYLPHLRQSNLHRIDWAKSVVGNSDKFWTFVKNKSRNRLQPLQIYKLYTDLHRKSLNMRNYRNPPTRSPLALRAAISPIWA